MSEREVRIQFAPDSKAIEVSVGDFTITVDGGDQTNPSPGVYFLTGLLACTASTARGYCASNGLPLPLGMKAVVENDDGTRLVSTVKMQLLVPSDFPEDRLDALLKAAGKCTVKKWWQNPPEFSVQTEIVS